MWSDDPLQFLPKAQQCGFDTLEINAPNVARMSDAERATLKAAADEAGLNYGAWPAKLLPGQDKRVLTDRAVESVREAMKAAEDCGVLFCVEVVNRFEHYMLNTAEEGVAFAKQVGSPNCKLLLDTFHMNIEEESFRGALVDTGDLLGHFHLGETNRRPPGTGRMPWRDLWRAAGDQLPGCRDHGAVPLARRRGRAATCRSIGCCPVLTTATRRRSAPCSSCVPR